MDASLTYGPASYDQTYQAPPPSYGLVGRSPVTTPQPSYDDGDSTTVSKSKLAALAIFAAAAIGFGVGVAFGASILVIPCILCAIVALGIALSFLPHNPNPTFGGYVGVHKRDVHHHHHHGGGGRGVGVPAYMNRRAGDRAHLDGDGTATRATGNPRGSHGGFAVAPQHT